MSRWHEVTPGRPAVSPGCKKRRSWRWAGSFVLDVVLPAMAGTGA
ncbi:hypothetical protein [Salmonella sp. E393-2]